MKKNLFLLIVALFISTTFIFAQHFREGKHPHYISALSNLRTARWMIDHHPGNWKQTDDEIEAVRRIDAAINEIRKASIDDGKGINDHDRIEEKPDHMGRLRSAVELLKKAREEVNKEEDNPTVRGLQQRSLDQINGAIRFTEKAIRH